jgi:hypothetical protein
MTSVLRSFSGHCHCEALGLTFHTAVPVSQWSVRACSCRFCRAHGARTTSDAAGRLSFNVQDARLLRRYRFGMKTADFLLCSRCGVYLGAQIEINGRAYGIVNTAALTSAAAELPAAVAADYGAESSSDRVRRREQRWTPLDALA